MHTTEGPRRVGTWPKIAVLAALTLLASSIAAGGAVAATPSWNMVVTPLPSQVAPGDVAGYRVVISNTGSSNISQVFLTNALVTKDGLESADPAQILDTVFVTTSQGTCDPVGERLDCTLKAIKSGKSATVIVAYDTDLATSQLRVIFEANTTGVAGDNPGSSHGDVLQGIGLTALNGSGNFGGRFVTAGNSTVANEQALSALNLQSAKVVAPKTGIPVTVADGDQTTPISCPVACWSETVELNVDGGTLYPGLFKLEIGVHKDLSETVHGFYHVFDAGHVPAAEDIVTKCPKNGNPNAPCFSVTKLGGNDILVTVWLKENGKGALY
jgi:hypothetical protein